MTLLIPDYPLSRMVALACHPGSTSKQGWILYGVASIQLDFGFPSCEVEWLRLVVCSDPCYLKRNNHQMETQRACRCRRPVTDNNSRLRPYAILELVQLDGKTVWLWIKSRDITRFSWNHKKKHPPHFGTYHAFNIVQRVGNTWTSSEKCGLCQSYITKSPSSSRARTSNFGRKNITPAPCSPI